MKVKLIEGPMDGSFLNVSEPLPPMIKLNIKGNDHEDNKLCQYKLQETVIDGQKEFIYFYENV